MDAKQSLIKELKEELASIVGLFDKLETGNGTTQQAPTEPEFALLGELPHRVIHLKDNPTDLHLRAKQSEFEQLKRENARLRARCELLECGNNADVTRRIDDAVDQSHQIELLTRKLEELETRKVKILDSLKKTAREFRGAIYLLTGYRVDAWRDRVYRLSHVYSENEEDELFFEISPTGSIQLLKNKYSDKISEEIGAYLLNDETFPVFLASITMNLFKSRTQLVSVPMSLSSTIVPSSQ